MCVITIDERKAKRQQRQENEINKVQLNGMRWEDVPNTEILYIFVYEPEAIEYFELIPHSCTHTK